MRRFRFAIVAGLLFVAGGGALYLQRLGRQSLAAAVPHVMDRRCRGGCTNSALLWLLRGGPSPSQIGAGSLTTANGTSVTDTRASNKTCTTSTGVTVLSSNQPCVDTVGLNVEGSATNLLLQSDDLSNASWAKFDSGGTATWTGNTTDVTAPDGTHTATKVVIPSTSVVAFHVARQTPTMTAGNPYTCSGYVLGAVGSSGNAFLYVSDSNGYNRVAATYSTSVWTRYSVTVASMGTSPLVDFGVNGNDAVEVPQPAQTVYTWRLQCEAGSLATSAIATTGTTATRAADDAQVTNALSSNPGTWCVAATVMPLGSAWTATAGVLAAGTAAAANSWSLSLTSSGKPTFSVYDGTPAQKVFTATSTISVASHRIEACDAAGTLTVLVDGSSAAGATTGAGTGVLASQPATLLLGETATGGTNPLWAELYSVCQGTTQAGCQ